MTSSSTQCDGVTPITTVILLCGLPASGKSTLARWIKQELEKHERSRRRPVLHLEYDAFEDEYLLQKNTSDQFQAVQQEGHELPPLRTAERTEHDATVVRTDSTTKQQQQQEEQRQREAWKEARGSVLSTVRQELSKKIDSDDIPEFLLLDDNYHLRGMRKEIHRLLFWEFHKPKKISIRFGVVRVVCPVQECLERNRNRTRSVPDHVIQRMSSNFEPLTARWEQSFINVTTTTTTTSIATNDDQESQLDDLMTFVRHCSSIVNVPEEEDVSEQAASDRRVTTESHSHHVDQLLRRWVGLVAKHDKKLAKAANMVRKQLFQEWKDQERQNGDASDLLVMKNEFLKRVLSSSIAPVTPSTSSEISTSTTTKEDLDRLLSLAIKEVTEFL